MSVIFTEDQSFHYVPTGFTYIMAHPNPTSKHMIQNGIFEKDLIEWCAATLVADKIFLDIGAHIGTYSIHLASNFKQVHAFEPQRHTFLCLSGNIALNNKSQTIVPHNVALTSPEKQGNVLLNIVSADGGGSSISEPNGHVFGQEVVKACTLDSLNIRNVGFIKIDVEGSELDVLKGAQETLKECGYPPILFESWTEEKFAAQRQELFDFVISMGYKILQKTSQMFFALH